MSVRYRGTEREHRRGFGGVGSLINRMEVMAEGPYRVEHDQSKNLLAYHDLLQRFIDHDQEIEFRQSEIAILKFPLKLVEVKQVELKGKPCRAIG